MIVDDNATNREILILQTRSWQMLPCAVASGDEALRRIAQEDPFDLIILDMQMPQMDGLTLAAAIRDRSDCQRIPLVMLTSIGRLEILSEGREVDFAAFLNKPIKQSQLYNALVQVFSGRPIKVEHSRLSKPKLDPTMALQLPLRILVAEDNKVNQQLALQLLQRLGYRAEVVSNGLEVIEALSLQFYDVVFMDVQMPEMDGLEATRRICAQWPPASRPRIIAMTANAMQGDREMCLEAGMDDYVSKPIRVDELVAALRRSDTGLEDLKREHQAIPILQKALDLEVLQSFRETMGEDASEYLATLIGIYLEESPGLLQSLEDAIAQTTPAVMEAAAHTLKSSSAGLGAITLSQLCQKIESLGKAQTVNGAAEIVAKIKSEYERVKVALQMEQQGVQG